MRVINACARPTPPPFVDTVTTWERGDAAPGGNVIAASSQAVYEEALAVIHAA